MLTAKSIRSAFANILADSNVSHEVERYTNEYRNFLTWEALSAYPKLFKVIYLTVPKSCTDLVAYINEKWDNKNEALAICAELSGKLEISFESCGDAYTIRIYASVDVCKVIKTREQARIAAEQEAEELEAESVVALPENITFIQTDTPEDLQYWRPDYYGRKLYNNGYITYVWGSYHYGARCREGLVYCGDVVIAEEVESAQDAYEICVEHFADWEWETKYKKATTAQHAQIEAEVEDLASELELHEALINNPEFIADFSSSAAVAHDTTPAELADVQKFGAAHVNKAVMMFPALKEVAPKEGAKPALVDAFIEIANQTLTLAKSTVTGSTVRECVSGNVENNLWVLLPTDFVFNSERERLQAAYEFLAKFEQPLEVDNPTPDFTSSSFLVKTIFGNLVIVIIDFGHDEKIHLSCSLFASNDPLNTSKSFSKHKWVQKAGWRLALAEWYLSDIVPAVLNAAKEIIKTTIKTNPERAEQIHAYLQSQRLSTWQKVGSLHLLKDANGLILAVVSEDTEQGAIERVLKNITLSLNQLLDVFAGQTFANLPELRSTLALDAQDLSPNDLVLFSTKANGFPTHPQKYYFFCTHSEAGYSIKAVSTMNIPELSTCTVSYE